MRTSAVAVVERGRAGRRHALEVRRFSLIELGVVIFLIALVLGLVAPRVGRVPRAVAVRSLVGTVQSAFREAGLRARATGQTVRLKAVPEENCLRVLTARSAAEEGQAEQQESESQGLSRAFIGAEKYRFPIKTKWEEGGQSPAWDSEAAQYRFFPGGEAAGPELVVKLRNQAFRIAVDPLTGRAIVEEEAENW